MNIKLICFLISTQIILSLSSSSQTGKKSILELIRQKKAPEFIHEHLKKGINLETNLLRKIDGNDVQLIAEINLKEGVLHLLIQADRQGTYLSLANLTKADKSETATETIFIFYDNFRLNRFLNFHNTIYSSTISVDDLKQFQVHRFGPACSYAGIPSKGYKEMESLVSKKDTATLRGYTRSANYELKILGLKGLQRLENTGIKLYNSDKELIKHLILADIPINFCLGCTFWEPMSSSTLLQNFL